MRRVLSIAALCCAMHASRGAAQDYALPDGIGASTRAALERLIDSARTAGIPRGPLYDKVSEGVLKGATDDRILRAVQSLARELGEARSALGPPADASVIGAAASALHAGVSPADLRRLAHPSGPPPDPGTLATALVTLVDLVAKHVPVSLATSSIQNLIEHRASDRQFTALRAGVEQDILAGRAPEASVAARVRAQLGASPP